MKYFTLKSILTSELTLSSKKKNLMKWIKKNYNDGTMI